jgi:hypothetical protein
MPRTTSLARTDHTDTQPAEQPQEARTPDGTPAPAKATRTRRSPRSARVPQAPVPLGSLTQQAARGGPRCSSCGSQRVTELAMTLTDGTPVRFLSCHRCEERSWLDLDGKQLPVDRVLDKTRKLA